MGSLCSSGLHLTAAPDPALLGVSVPADQTRSHHSSCLQVEHAAADPSASGAAAKPPPATEQKGQRPSSAGGKPGRQPQAPHSSLPHTAARAPMQREVSLQVGLQLGCMWQMYQGILSLCGSMHFPKDDLLGCAGQIPCDSKPDLCCACRHSAGWVRHLLRSPAQRSGACRQPAHARLVLQTLPCQCPYQLCLDQQALGQPYLGQRNLVQRHPGQRYLGCPQVLADTPDSSIRRRSCRAGRAWLAACWSL